MTALEQAPARDPAAEPTPDAIMELGFAFWGSKTLLSAVELRLFSELAPAGALDAEALRERLRLNQRGARDFFDALVALGLLERDDGVYRNTPATDVFLDRAKPTYLGALLEIASTDLWRDWASLTDALRTGKPQNEIADGGDLYEAMYSDPEKLRAFLKAMTANSAGMARTLASAFPWDHYETVIDVGGAEGCVPVQVALAHEHLSGGVFDLPVVRPFFDEYVAAAGLSDRLRFHAGDFFVDDLPRADVLIMGHILHNWNDEQKQLLLAKAHAALHDGGSLIVYEPILDDDRRENAFGLLMSLHMLVETRGGSHFTGAECRRWMRDAGFCETYVQELVGPGSMVVGVK